MQKILITGITGQDGLFLTSKILNSNDKAIVYGATRASNNNIFFKKLRTLTNVDFSNVKLINIDLANFSETNNFLKDIQPDYIYNLSGPSSVYKSLNDNGKTYSKIINIFNNLIDSLLKNSISAEFFQASSSEMFSKTSSGIYQEKSALSSNTPYSEAKLINHLRILELSEELGLNFKSGIMFNHESEFRESEYLVMQVINSAKDIAGGVKSSFKIGSDSITRDWSFAGDVADAIYKINNFGQENCYVIGSGKGKTIKELVNFIFKYFDLNYEEYLIIDKNLNRKNNNEIIVSNPEKIKRELSWKPSLNFEDMLLRCIEKKFVN